LFSRNFKAPGPAVGNGAAAARALMSKIVEVDEPDEQANSDSAGDVSMEQAANTSNVRLTRSMTREARKRSVRRVKRWSRIGKGHGDVLFLSYS
jgi:hypothetical protein